MVGTGRFELPTCRLGGDRSIHLSYVPEVYISILPALQPLLSDISEVMDASKADPVDSGLHIRLRT
jgi:hypothetical protein